MHELKRQLLTAFGKAKARYAKALKCFKANFSPLFNAVAEEKRLTPRQLGALLGWGPIPEGGNKIMLGMAEPSDQDCFKLLDVWQDVPVRK